MSIAAEIAATIAKHEITESKRRDDYGRSVTELVAYDKTTRIRSVVVLVTLPKTSTDRYLVNNWSKSKLRDGEENVWYFQNRNDAKKHAVDQLVESQQKKLAAAPKISDKHKRELAETIATQMQAIAEGTLQGSVTAQLALVRNNLATLEAWVGDDRS